MSEPEKLTDDDREKLFWVRDADRGDVARNKALRIIDALTADRAALVAQLEAAKANQETGDMKHIVGTRYPKAVCYCLKSEESDCPVKAAGKCPRFNGAEDCDSCGDPLDADHPNPCLPCYERPEPDSSPAHTHAALVAQLEAAEALFIVSDNDRRKEWERAEALVAQVTELTRELTESRQMVAVATLHRDEARDIARKVPGLEFDLKAKANECEIADAEVARLTEALDAAKADDQLSRTQRDVLQGEVGRLKEALAAAEREASEFYSAGLAQGERLDAAEARVRELEADVRAWQKASEDATSAADTAEARVRELEESMTYRTSLVGRLESECAALRAEVDRLRAERKERDDMWHRRQENWRSSSDRCLKAAESRLAAANALLKRALDKDPLARRDIRSHLAAQPAPAPARTEAEQRVLDAVKRAVDVWQQGGPFNEVEAIEAELARRGGK